MDRYILMEQTLADRGDGEELIDTELAFDGQPTTALPNMPLACISLLNMWYYALLPV